MVLQKVMSEWKTIVRNFYPDLEEAVSEIAEKELERLRLKMK